MSHVLFPESVRAPHGSAAEAGGSLVARGVSRVVMQPTQARHQPRSPPTLQPTPYTSLVLTSPDFDECLTRRWRRCARAWPRMAGASSPKLSPGLPSAKRDPKPQTPNPKPQTPNPTPHKPNPKPQTQNPTPHTPKPKPQTPRPTPHTPNFTPQTPNPKPQTPNPRPQTLNAKRQTPKQQGGVDVHHARSRTRPGTRLSRKKLSSSAPSSRSYLTRCINYMV